MIVSIPPKLAIARFVGQVKASASTRVNKQLQREGALIWQEEYGVFSFDGKRLPNYIAYVDRQQEHHSANRIIPILERTGSELANVSTVRESPAHYLTIADDWWKKMLVADENDSAGYAFAPQATKPD